MPKTTYTHICDYCGKTHEISTTIHSRIQKGKQKHCYCSVECKSNAESKTVKCECSYCGKIIEKKLSKYILSGNHFCSGKCSDLYKHFENTEERICPICNNIFRVGKKSKQKFCSVACQNAWQKTLVGELNSHYKNNNVKCKWCGKYFHVSEYRKNNTNNLFCSVECKRKWYANVWSQSEEWKNKSKIRAVNILQNRKSKNINSIPQLIVNDILNELNIEYINEYNIKYYSVDNYLTTYRLFIEVHGDYWHSNPLKYGNKINETQANRIKIDKAKNTYIKNTYIKNKYNCNVLYLWENDIKNNVNLIRLLILKFIENNGNLNNYNSFNYYLEDEILLEKEQIIKSYQEQNIEEYKDIIQRIS